MFLLFELKLFHIHRDKINATGPNMSSTNFFLKFLLKKNDRLIVNKFVYDFLEISYHYYYDVKH